jgi:hypothetical protein
MMLMIPPTNLEITMGKMLQAVKELEDYFRSGAHDSEKYRQLARAAKVAIDEFTKQAGESNCKDR